MRKIVLLFWLVCFVAAGAAAQVSSPLKVYGGGGLSFPAKPDAFKDSYKKGFHGFVAVGLPVFPKLEALPKLEYHTFGGDLSNVGGGDVRVLMVGVDGKLNLTLPMFPIKPYLIAGIGMAGIRQTEFDTPNIPQASDLTLENQTKFYYNLGAGTAWKLLMAVDLFAQVHYVAISTSADGKSFDDATRFWALSVGIKIL
ncbi:MAG: outer membrane beta-barrel protein [bacterium]